MAKSVFTRTYTDFRRRLVRARKRAGLTQVQLARRLSRPQSFVSKRSQECNWLQAMEGGIDSSHVSFLHRGDLNSDPLHRNTAGAKFTRSNTNTVFDILESPGGLLIGARRDADPGYHYWRITQWLMPWYTLIPPYKGHAANGHLRQQ